MFSLIFLKFITISVAQILTSEVLLATNGGLPDVTGLQLTLAERDSSLPHSARLQIFILEWP